MSTPPYPLHVRRGHWLTGWLAAFRTDRLGLLMAHARHGPIVRFRLGFKTLYFLSDPDLVQEMLVTQHRHLGREPMLRAVLARTMGNGLLTSDGAYWQRQRRMLAPAFHRSRVQRAADLMVAHAAALTAHWQDGEERDLEREMDRLTLSIVTAALFRIDSAAQADTVARVITALQAIGNRELGRLIRLPNWIPTPDHRTQRRLSRQLRDIVMAGIDARRRSGDAGDDLLSILLDSVDAETGARMTDAQICDEVITLYLAGYDTTALTLSFCWYELARNPAIAARLHAELDAVLPARRPTLADLDRLPYTRMLFNEALRLYPPAYFLIRQVVRPVQIGGHPIRPGAILITSPYVMHRHPAYWDEPERFHPERFADHAERGWHRYRYFPFGGGPRVCIGNQFALLEGPLILATIARSYRFELREPGWQVQLEPQITLGPQGGMPLRLRRRTATV
ncbi:MAG: cytochrome P450 [Chromatiaceae bacterium]|nr:MAG: cytochrome P450 [Chromatiaceae bacterium]